MLSVILLLAVCALHTQAVIMPRADPPFQQVPLNATTPNNKFNNGTFHFKAQPAITTNKVSDVYGPRSIDIPFALLNFGTLKFFPPGQLNTPRALTGTFAPGVNDFANQSACGIPDNAYHPSKVAIHPYWLKYAPANLGLSSKSLSSPQSKKKKSKKEKPLKPSTSKPPSQIIIITTKLIPQLSKNISQDTACKTPASQSGTKATTTTPT